VTLARDVTVSIVNFRRADTLLPLLRSLEADVAGPLDVEIVVLDNASQDGSVEAVRERFPDVRVIAQEHRAGFGANHNRVIRETDGRWVYLLSHDAEVEPGSLPRLVEYGDARPEVGAVAPQIRYPDGRTQPSAWRFPSPATAALGLPTLARAGVVQSTGQRPRRVDWAMGAALLLRREALASAGLFDESFFMYSEETDLLRRFRDLGYETHFLPAVTVTHHDSDLRAEVPHERIVEEWRGRHRYWRKHHSPAGARLAAALTGAQYAARAGIAALANRARPGSFDPSFPERMRLHAREAWHGGAAPGLREAVEEWNRRQSRKP
jgi:N-acetylglucosaminyl-diphospho-decaprenol L-rhamnosyltransferase